MRRGYVRRVPRNPVEKQRAALDEAGGNPVYAEAVPDDAIASLRTGDELAIAGDLRILGDNREVIRERVKEVRERGASIVDVTTGRTVADDGAEMMAEAIRLIAGEKVRHIDHKAAADARWDEKRKGIIPLTQV